MKNTETGIYKQANGNFGFIDLEDGTSIFVHGSKSRGAFDGDEVTFHRLPSGYDRQEARIVRIDKRSTTPKFGIFTYSKKIPIIKLFSPEGKIVIISENRIPFPQPGTTVGVEIAGSGVQTFAILTSIIGRETDFEFEENLLIASTGVPQNFTHRVEQEARSLKTGKPGPHRKDLRGRTIITIDGADAKDLDDAIEVVPTKEGYILCVHIADVAEYVTEGTSLDREALRRGTSIYLADRVIPMLPKELSNELCSLHPGSAKFCLSVDMHIDQLGQVLSTHLYESLIQTAHRGTYEEVQQAYDTGKSDTLSDAVLAMLSHAWKLKHILDKRRFGEWKIQFPSRETKLVLENGKVMKILPREHLESHDLIEAFMVIANEEVAKWSIAKRVPFLYRVHDQPTDEGVKRLKDTFDAFGVPFDLEHPRKIKPKDIQLAVAAIRLRDPEGYSTKPLLTAMSKALYSEKCLGHFGLALRAYSHFTSPIRRYPDLQIHRLIKHELHKDLNQAERARFANHMPKVARITSTLERRAERLEYDFRDLKICQYLTPFIGQTFSGVVSTVLENGYFVEFMPSIEGFCAISKYTKRIKIDVGAKITVRLESVDIRMRRVDLINMEV